MPSQYHHPPLPGLESYVCTFDCLDCPVAPGPCPYDDPGLRPWTESIQVDPREYDALRVPDHEDWRIQNLPPDREYEDYYKEPDPAGQTYRCPRCKSTHIHMGHYWIVCYHCGYSEPLYDFPSNI